MKIYKENIVCIILLIVIAFLSWNIAKINKTTNDNVAKIEKVNKEDNLHTTIYYDQTIASLKKENKELYDSLKAYKDKIDYLIQFTYKKKYSTDKVYIDSIKTDDIQEYAYNGNQNDTLKYNLVIGSKEEPAYYKLDMEISERFTIVNKNIGNLNETDIRSDGNGIISDVTVLKKKRKFIDRFVIGPSVTVGYDVNSKQFGAMVGVSITFDAFKK